MAFYNEEGFEAPKNKARNRGGTATGGTGTGVSTTSLGTPGLVPEGGGGPLENTGRSWQERAGGGIGNTGRPQGPLTYSPPEGSGGSDWQSQLWPTSNGGFGAGQRSGQGGNTGVSGYGEGGRPVPGLDTQNPRDFISQMLQGVQYGPAGLGSKAADFARYGYNVNTASDGGVRGRITAPDGSFYDVLDPNESRHWWTDLRGQNWNVGQRQTAPAGGGGSSDLLALLQAMMSGSGSAPGASAPPPTTMPSWPTPAPAPAPNVSGAPGDVPPQMALQDQGLSRAMSMLAMQMPQLFASGRPLDPLVAQLLGLTGRGF